MKLNFKDFFLQINKIQTPIFYFTGPEDYLKLRAKERLLKRAEWVSWPRVKINPNEIESQELLTELGAPALFSSGEIIIFNEINKIPAAVKKDLLEILDAMENQEPLDKILVFISQEERTDPSDPLEGHFLASPKATHVFFPYLTTPEVISWAKGEAKRRNIVWEADVWNEVAVTYGNDIYLWANLLETLDVYLADTARTPTKQDLMNWVLSSSPQEGDCLRKIEESILEILKSDSSGSSLKNTLEAVNVLFKATSETPQAAALRVLRMLGDIVYEIGLAKTKQIQSKWDWPLIEEFYAIVLEGERAIKTGALEPTIALEKTLTALWESNLNLTAPALHR